MAERIPTTCNCSALRQAARYATRLYDDALAPVGLGINQYSVLANIDRGGPSALQALADHLVMDRSTLGHLLRPIEARGLVSVAAPSRDKRQRVISLTRDGAALLKAAQPYWAEAQSNFERAFGAGAAGSLRETLATVTALRFGDDAGTTEGARA